MIDISHFSGQQDGEVIHLFLRRHPLALAWSLRWVALAFAAAVTVLAVFGTALAPLGGLLAAATLIVAVALGLAALWVYAIWYYDVYIVTDRRLLDFARKPLIYERRDEAQLSKVQNVRIEYPNPLALILNFGNVEVQTAGSKGAITCSLVAKPRQVQARILDLTSTAQQRAAAAPSPETEEMREYLGLPGASSMPETSAAPLVTPRPTAWRAYLRSLLRPNLDVQATDRVWRKHWWMLLRSTALSGLLFNAGLVLAILMLWQMGPTWLLVIPLAMVIVGGIWNLWNVIDWQNDLYILTDDRIVDIEKVPFISEDRREARLHQIQDVHYVMSGFINRFLDFGDVEVETAGRGGGLTFNSVPHPRDVQSEVFRRVEQARRSAGQADQERQETGVLDMLYRYRQAGQPGAEDSAGPGAS